MENSKHKKIFEKWIGNKVICLIDYRNPWRENGIKPMWGIRTNGAKRKNGDTCLDVNIYLGYLVFMYTNWEFNRGRLNK